MGKKSNLVGKRVYSIFILFGAIVGVTSVTLTTGGDPQGRTTTSYARWSRTGSLQLVEELGDILGTRVTTVCLLTVACLSTYNLYCRESIPHTVLSVPVYLLFGH